MKLINDFKRRSIQVFMGVIALMIITGCTSIVGHRPVGTGDMGVVIERASGRIAIINTTTMNILGKVGDLGDLSHASVVFSRDGRYAYVFGREIGRAHV